jgi:hypothetical protein
MSRPDALSDRLDQLGDALHAAVTADLARAPRDMSVAEVAPVRRSRRRIVGAIVAAVIAVPGVALAANAVISAQEVARSLPNGTLALLGTHPTCTTVQPGIEFDCVLASAPSGDVAPGAWQGAAEPTVNDKKRVNGGCRSTNAAGTHWRCYVGEEAVRQQIIGPHFLGQAAPTPGVG